MSDIINVGGNLYKITDDKVLDRCGNVVYCTTTCFKYAGSVAGNHKHISTYNVLPSITAYYEWNQSSFINMHTGMEHNLIDYEIIYIDNKYVYWNHKDDRFNIVKMDIFTHEIIWNTTLSTMYDIYIKKIVDNDNMLYISNGYVTMVYEREDNVHKWVTTHKFSILCMENEYALTIKDNRLSIRNLNKLRTKYPVFYSHIGRIVYEAYDCVFLLKGNHVNYIDIWGGLISDYTYGDDLRGLYIDSNNQIRRM